MSRAQQRMRMQGRAWRLLGALLLGVAAFAGRREGDARSDVELLAIARLIGAASGIVGRRTGLVAHGEETPMLAVSGASVAEVQQLLDDTATGGTAVVAAVNGPPRLVVSLSLIHI